LPYVKVRRFYVQDFCSFEHELVKFWQLKTKDSL
jgi:hypothetical protein